MAGSRERLSPKDVLFTRVIVTAEMSLSNIWLLLMTKERAAWISTAARGHVSPAHSSPTSPDLDAFVLNNTKKHKNVAYVTPHPPSLLFVRWLNWDLTSEARSGLRSEPVFLRWFWQRLISPQKHTPLIKQTSAAKERRGSSDSHVRRRSLIFTAPALVGSPTFPAARCQ